MSAAMTHGERCLLAVSPEREVSRMSDGELRELIDEIAARPWTNEFWDRLAGIAVEVVVNRWMAGGARSQEPGARSQEPGARSPNSEAENFMSNYPPMKMTDPRFLERIRKVQRALGFTGADVDAKIGHNTLSRIEDLVFDPAVEVEPLGGWPTSPPEAGPGVDARSAKNIATLLVPVRPHTRPDARAGRRRETHPPMTTLERAILALCILCLIDPFRNRP